jgi:hypothetical protein
MSDTPTRYPLAWPAGRPRCKTRRPGNFSYKENTGRGYYNTKPLTVSMALNRLEAEVGRLGGVNTLLSTNLELKLNGEPRSGQSEPSDPGVALYFMLKGKPIAMACDAYTKAAQNIAALAAHIEATRAIERYGVATAAETLQAFQALPPPAEEKPKTPWHKVFGVMPEVADEEQINTLYRVFAKRRAQDEDALRELNVAKDEALAAIRRRTPVA